MKILWLGVDYHDSELLKKTWYRHNYQAILDRLREREEVVCYANHYCGDYNQAYDVEKIVAKEEPDVVLIYDSAGWKNLDKVDTLKAVRFSDPWSSHKQHLKFANTNKIDIVFVKFYIAVSYYIQHIKHKCTVIGWPHQVDERIFHPSLSLTRDIDVWCTGNFSRKTHPIRSTALEQLADHPELRTYIKSGQGLSLQEYVELINRSKMGVFDDVHKPLLGGSFFHRMPLGKWAVGKWFENMSCKTLCLANTPTAYTLLHFTPSVNFVKVTPKNLLGKVLYYREHENERKEIAERGYETFLEYHTCEKRVEQMLKVINRCLP